MAEWTNKPQVRFFDPRFWLLLLWMLAIFSASGDAQSMHRSSRILEPIIRLLMPGCSDQSVARAVFIGRKCAHLTEYAILAILCYLAFSPAAKPRGQPAESHENWKRRVANAFAEPLGKVQAARILALVAIYAASDEIHQSFVPNRYGSSIDVMIDVCGGALGLLAIFIFQKLGLTEHSQTAT